MLILSEEVIFLLIMEQSVTDITLKQHLIITTLNSHIAYFSKYLGALNGHYPINHYSFLCGRSELLFSVPEITALMYRTSDSLAKPG